MPTDTAPTSSFAAAAARPPMSEADIEAEQLRRLAERSLSSVRSGLIGVAVLVLSQARTVAWAVLLVFSVIRLLNIWHNHWVCTTVQRLGVATALTQGYLARLEWGLCATGVTWGLASWMLPDPMGSNLAAHFLILILVGVNGVMVNTAALTRRAVVFFTIGLWATLVLRFAWLHDPYARYLIIGGLIYAGISLAHGLHLHDQARRGIVAELHNRLLLDAMRRASLREQAQKAELSQANEQLTAALERAHALASYDELTGLLNRRAFHDRVNAELSAQRRHDELSALVLVDLDQFKKVNDRYGHEAGDKVLQRVATALQTTLRGADILARWGGEEFLVFMPRTHSSEACAAAERLRQALQHIDPAALPAGLQISASIGVTEMNTHMTLEAAIALADRGVFVAKSNGPGRIYLAGPNQALAEVPAANAVVTPPAGSTDAPRAQT